MTTTTAETDHALTEEDRKSYAMTFDIVALVKPYGVSAKQLQTWLERRYLTSAEGGNGQGKHRRFTFMQAFGIAVACKIYTSERGCTLAHLKKVAAGFGAIPEAILLDWIGNDQEFLSHVCHDTNSKRLSVLLSHSYEPGHIDLAITYRETKNALAGALRHIELIETSMKPTLVKS